MAQTKGAAASIEHDHDRIVMPSRRADGTMDQFDPEFIGDKDAAKRAARRQSEEQAASAVDVAERGVSTDDTASADSPQDPTIERIAKAQTAAADKAGKAVEAEVDKLHKGLGDDAA